MAASLPMTAPSPSGGAARLATVRCRAERAAIPGKGAAYEVLTLAMGELHVHRAASTEAPAGSRALDELLQPLTTPRVTSAMRSLE